MDISFSVEVVWATDGYPKNRSLPRELIFKSPRSRRPGSWSPKRPHTVAGQRWNFTNFAATRHHDLTPTYWRATRKNWPSSVRDRYGFKANAAPL